VSAADAPAKAREPSAAPPTGPAQKPPRLRILIFNIYFHPDPTGTGLVIGELARDLCALGHQVTVVTTVTHYGLDAIPESQRGRWLTEETWEGVRVLRTWVYMPRRKSFFSRVVNYLAFAFLAIPAGLKAGKHDVAVCVWPPVTTGLAAWVVTRLRRRPLVMNVQDVYPDTIFRWRLAARLSRAAERLLLRAAAGVTVLSEGLQRAVIQRGALEDRVRVVPMWTNTDEIRPGPRNNAFRARHGIAHDTFLILYAGNLGTFSGVGIALEAAALLKDDPHVRFLIVGRGHGKPALLLKAQSLALPNLTFLDTRPRPELPEMLAAADLSLATLDPRIATTSVPSKVFTIMASGRPVLAAMSPDNEIARIIAQTHCGWCVPADAPQAMAATIRAANCDPAGLDAMGARGRTYVEKFHARPPLTQRYAEVLEGVAVNRRAPS
jgi:colanic acid biosynthesis glycosyl transferase WcaI